MTRETNRGLAVTRGTANVCPCGLINALNGRERRAAGNFRSTVFVPRPRDAGEPGTLDGRRTSRRYVVVVVGNNVYDDAALLCRITWAVPAR